MPPQLLTPSSNPTSTIKPSYEIVPICTNVFSRWGEAMSRRVLSLQAHNLQPSDHFSGRASVARFHHCVVADIHASAHRVMRTSSQVSADNDKHFKIIWQISGRNMIEHRNDSIIIEPGQWTIYDTTEPYIVDTSDNSRFLVLLLPASELSRWESGIEFVTGRVLPTRGTAEIARAALAGMLANNVELGLDGEIVMQDSISALLGTAIAQIYGQTLNEQGAINRRLLKVQAYIDEHLTERDLCPEVIAQACNMSRRSLYTAFNAIGQTPSNYILQRRLSVAAQQLINPKLRTSITQLALELGFSDAAHFARVFSKKYGQSPSSWRNHKLAAGR